jgi:hypothetical protein
LGQFFQKFAAKIMPGSSRSVVLAVSAFGKHPGWDDHMEDVGHQAMEMLAFKRRFYVEGIGGNIDSGAWAHLPEPQRLPEFNHRLILSQDDYYILAQVVASRDGKGRSLYPLIVAVQARGLALTDLGRLISPVLENLRDTLAHATTAAVVQAAVHRSQIALDQMVPTLAPSSPKADRLVTGSQIARMFSDQNAPADAIARIFYSVQKAVQNCGRDGNIGRTETLRLPLDGQQPWFSARIWIAMLRSILNGPCPILAAEYRNPNGPMLTDLIIGPAGPGQLFCLRAGAARIPLVTDIPYDLTADFRNRVAGYVAQCRTIGDSPAPAFPV